MRTNVAILLIILLLFPVSAMGEIITIKHTVRQSFGGGQSQDDALISSMAKAKREVLEKAAIYIESLAVVQNSKADKDEILALTAGVLKTEVISQENYTSGDAVGIEIIVNAVVDKPVLEEKVKKLLQDKTQLKLLKDIQTREKELLQKVTKLEEENSKLTAEKQSTRQLKKEFQQASLGLASLERLYQAYSLWDGEKYTDQKKAIEYLNNAIKLQPDDAAAYNNRGNVYYKLGQYQVAIEDYNEATRLKPDYVNAYYSRGNSYYKLGQHKRAIEDFKIAAGLGHEVAQVILKSYGNVRILANIPIARKMGKVQAEQQYERIKGIELMNGNVIEGQIISINSERVKIRTNEGNILSYDLNKEVQRFVKDDIAVIKIPEKQSQSSMGNDKPSVQADQQYKGIKGIELMNGNFIEGQIISVDPEILKIRTKDGKVLSYSFKKEVKRFITK